MWFFHRDLQSRQTSQPPVEDSHNRCLARATCGAGRLFLLHTSSREQTNIFHWACHPFVKAQHVSGEAFMALFTRSARYACMQVNLNLWVHVCQYLFISPFNSQQPKCGFDYSESFLCYIERNCQLTIQSMQNHFFSSH